MFTAHSIPLHIGKQRENVRNLSHILIGGSAELLRMLHAAQQETFGMCISALRASCETPHCALARLRGGAENPF